MTQAQAPASQVANPHSVRSVELRQALPSQVAVIDPFVDQLMAKIGTLRGADGSEGHIDLALREALANAIVHGNHEDPHKIVEVEGRIGADGEVSITIRDEGQGFDAERLPDPTAASNQLSSHGRGVYLIRALMDEVSFEEHGTVVHMRKKGSVNARSS